MEVQNVKFHVRVKESWLPQYSIQLKNTSFKKKTVFSFCILRVGKFVYNCFFSGYINITGVRNCDAIATAIDALYWALDIIKTENIFTEHVIDNISAICNNLSKKKINLLEKKRLKDTNKEIIHIKYNRERFPNMFIKTEFGTIIWSPNNVVCTVGSKNLKALSKLSSLILLYS